MMRGAPCSCVVAPAVNRRHRIVVLLLKPLVKDRVDILPCTSQEKAPTPQPVDRYRLLKCLSYEPASTL